MGLSRQETVDGKACTSLCAGPWPLENKFYSLIADHCVVGGEMSFKTL